MLSVVFVISSPALSVFGSGAAMAPHSADSTKAKHKIRLAFMIGLGLLIFLFFHFFTSSLQDCKVFMFFHDKETRIYTDLEKPFLIVVCLTVIKAKTRPGIEAKLVSNTLLNLKACQAFRLRRVFETKAKPGYDFYGFLNWMCRNCLWI